MSETNRSISACGAEYGTEQGFAALHHHHRCFFPTASTRSSTFLLISPTFALRAWNSALRAWNSILNFCSESSICWSVISLVFCINSRIDAPCFSVLSLSDATCLSVLSLSDATCFSVLSLSDITPNANVAVATIPSTILVSKGGDKLPPWAIAGAGSTEVALIMSTLQILRGCGTTKHGRAAKPATTTRIGGNHRRFPFILHIWDNGYGNRCTSEDTCVKQCCVKNLWSTRTSGCLGIRTNSRWTRCWWSHVGGRSFKSSRWLQH